MFLVSPIPHLLHKSEDHITEPFLSYHPMLLLQLSLKESLHFQWSKSHIKLQLHTQASWPSCSDIVHWNIIISYLNLNDLRRMLLNSERFTSHILSVITELNLSSIYTSLVLLSPQAALLLKIQVIIRCIGTLTKTKAPLGTFTIYRCSNIWTPCQHRFFLSHTLHRCISNSSTTSNRLERERF